jgi:soluble lytic murein transglycosylase-like protein
MVVVVFLKKVVVWFVCIGFIAICAGCASDNHSPPIDTRVDLSVSPNKPVNAKQPVTVLNITKTFSKPSGYDATKSAQLDFKKIYDKYTEHTKKLTAMDKRDGANAIHSTANKAAIEYYRKNHISAEQQRSLLLNGNECMDQYKNTASYGANWRPITQGKAKIQPAKSNAMLRSFFYDRPVSSTSKRALKQFGERNRLNSPYTFSRHTTNFSRHTRGVSTILMHPCEPKLSILANNTSDSPSKAAKKAQFNNMIAQAAQRHQVDEKLVHAVIQTESAYNADATSSAGAVGLMQLMPGTAKQYGVTDRNDPNQNINGGTRYLRYLLDLFNSNMDLAVAAYNAGEHTVMKYHNSIPPYPETRNYVRQVLSLYNR